jgi:hypothetical protein
MAIAHASVTVDTTATDLTSGVADTGGNTTRSVVLTNGGSAAVYLGGPTVTSIAYGYALAVGGELALDLAPGDLLFGISAAAGGVVRVLHTGV